LQYRLWLSNDGMGEVLRLHAAVVARGADNARVSERNRQLAAEVRDLKQGYSALEERARSDLGMIAGNESFYQVVSPRALAPAAAPMAPALTLPNTERTAAAR
jgi:cell division protein FtsB